MVQTFILSIENLIHPVETLSGAVRNVICADRVCRKLVRAVILYLRITGRAEVRRCGQTRTVCNVCIMADATIRRAIVWPVRE
jgi:hypothetical protein